MVSARIAITTLLTIVGIVLTSASQAQAIAYNYDVLVDSDVNSATGCAATPTDGATTAGFEHRLTARVEVNGGAVSVVALDQRDCVGGAFSTPVAITTPVAPPWSANLNGGLSGADAVELAVRGQSIGAQAGGSVRLVFVADNGNGSDILASSDGSATGSALIVSMPGAIETIPSLSIFGLLVLFVALSVTAWVAHRRFSQVAAGTTVLLAAGLVWAMNFVPDGDLSDWSAVSPIGQDVTGDATDASPGNDLLAAFARIENDVLHLRIDVVDLDDRTPTAAADDYTTNEDTPLNVAAPGVLANDTDPESQPLSASLDSAPGNAASFTLNPDGSFDYTPEDGFNGSDSFSYTASDGENESPAATVTITVDGVNDAPSFTAGGDVTSLEDAGAQTVSGWASGIDDGDDNTQSLSFNVTGNSNPGLFSAAPAVNATTGELSYTAAPDANGSAEITLTLSDNGGTANGGTDTSAGQTFTINVTAVNDAPSFTPGPDQTAVEDAGAQSIGGWASNITDGDGGGQSLTFNTSTDNDGLFAALPNVDAATGTLSYTPAVGMSGAATVTTVLMDNGGTANGGVDQSPPSQFTITIQPGATAVADTLSVINGFSSTLDVLSNDTGPGLQAITFGDSLANVGTTPADGVTTLSVVAGGGTIDLTLASNGQLNATANATAGAGTISVFYETQASNCSTDAAQIDVSYGNFPIANDDTRANLGAGNEYATSPGVTLSISVGTGLLNNDTLGSPAATLVAWGGGEASALVNQAPASSRPFAGGTLTVNSDGSFNLTNPTTPGSYSFDYILDNGIGTSQASVEIFVGDFVDLAVEKSVDDPTPGTGSNVTYTIRVENLGSAAATGVMIETELPLDNINLTFVSSTESQGTFTANNPGPSLWNIGALNAGQTAILQLTTTVNISAGSITGTASLASLDQSDINSSNDSDTSTITVN